MSSQEIINYVMNTPHNTNPAILKQMIDANSSGGGGYDIIIAFDDDRNARLEKGTYQQFVDACKFGAFPSYIVIRREPLDNYQNAYPCETYKYELYDDFVTIYYDRSNTADFVGLRSDNTVWWGSAD